MERTPLEPHLPLEPHNITHTDLMMCSNWHCSYLEYYSQSKKPLMCSLLAQEGFPRGDFTQSSVQLPF